MGAPAGFEGTVAAVVAVAAPAPAAFTAATRNRYDTPFTSPPTVAVVVVETPSATACQVAPPSLERSTT